MNRVLVGVAVLFVSSACSDDDGAAKSFTLTITGVGGSASGGCLTYVGGAFGGGTTTFDANQEPVEQACVLVPVFITGEGNFWITARAFQVDLENSQDVDEIVNHGFATAANPIEVGVWNFDVLDASLNPLRQGALIVEAIDQAAATVRVRVE